mgnify:CR=1 FL=1
MISVIIPTYGRVVILDRVLYAFTHQSCKDFEVILVSDGDETGALLYKQSYQMPFPMKVVWQENAGPAKARNIGVEHAKSDIVCFIGDDCIPARDFVFQHTYSHLKYREGAVQGYTIWHPDIVDDFMRYLYESGIQVNEPALKDGNGWKEKVDGFFMTTNVSITKRAFHNVGGFSDKFPAAAWEDVHIGAVLAQQQTPTYFNHKALNYHWHKQTLDSYIHRQMTEGASRLVLCELLPELSGNLIDSVNLRKFDENVFNAAVADARETHYSQSPDFQELRRYRWGKALQLASLKGML